MTQHSALRISRALVRLPSRNFASGLTTSDLGPPDYDRALRQHGSYCLALERCGLTVTRLEPDERYPDSTFVEDTAVLVRSKSSSNLLAAIITRPGAASRLGEVEQIDQALRQFDCERYSIREPGMLDGGDVCQAGGRFFIGISARTNENGAHQLAEILGNLGYTTDFIDIRSLNCLHLKSDLAYLGDKLLVVSESLSEFRRFSNYELLRVAAGEEYAANCVRINDHVLVAAGFPLLKQKLDDFEYNTIELDMSEFQKMDGGLSCLSLRW